MADLLRISIIEVPFCLFKWLLLTSSTVSPMTRWFRRDQSSRILDTHDVASGVRYRGFFTSVLPLW